MNRIRYLSVTAATLLAASATFCGSAHAVGSRSTTTPSGRAILTQSLQTTVTSFHTEGRFTATVAGMSVVARVSGDCLTTPASTYSRFWVRGKTPVNGKVTSIDTHYVTHVWRTKGQRLEQSRAVMRATTPGARWVNADETGMVGLYVCQTSLASQLRSDPRYLKNARNLGSVVIRRRNAWRIDIAPSSTFTLQFCVDRGSHHWLRFEQAARPGSTTSVPVFDYSKYGQHVVITMPTGDS